MTTSARISHWLASHRTVVDVALVVLLGIPMVLMSAAIDPATSNSTTMAWAAAGIAPLVVRRRDPVVSAVAVFAVGALQVAFGPPLVLPANFAILVALHAVTVHGPRWAGRAAMGGIAAGAVALALRGVSEFGPTTLFESALFGGATLVTGAAVWAFAMLRRARQDTVDAVHDRAERLERERDQQAQIAAASERARIAREMHDIVAHSLSVVVAQADGGRYAARNDPAVAVPVLETIGETGRAALADVRRILGVLRDGPASDAATDGAAGASEDPAAPLTPQPTAGDLDALLRGVRAAGVEVSLTDLDAPVALPAGLELTVHRILQEALTNVIKHAGPDPAVTVSRRVDGARLVLEVTDDGRGAAAAGPGPDGGHGLVGMRERVALFDGTLDAGPREGGGFRVRAELPLAATPSAPSARDGRVTT